jgi:hypothetical protein
MCGSPRMSVVFRGPGRAIITTDAGSREWVSADCRLMSEVKAAVRAWEDGEESRWAFDRVRRALTEHEAASGGSVAGPGPGVSRLVALLEYGIELLSGEHPIEDYGTWKAEAREAIEDNRSEEDRMTWVVTDLIERFLIKKETMKGHELLKELRELKPIVTYPMSCVRLTCESEDGHQRVYNALSDFISADEGPAEEGNRDG